MGTFQDSNPDRDRLRRSYVDTSTTPYSIDATTELMGRLAAGTGGSRAVRVVVRVSAVLALLPFTVLVTAWIVGLR